MSAMCCKLSSCGNAGKGALRAEADHRLTPPQLVPRQRGAVHRSHPESSSFGQEEIAEAGLADAHRVRQHALKHRLQLARRTGDDPQHLGGRGLVLQRLGKVLPASASSRVRDELLFQINARFADTPDARSRLRSGSNEACDRSFGSSRLCETRSPGSPHAGCHKPRIRSSRVDRIARWRERV